MCPIHKIWLTKTNVRYTEKTNKHEFICIEQCKFIEEKEKNVSYFSHLIFIAEQTYYLLNHLTEPLGLKRLNEFYVIRLQQEGYATMTGRIKWFKLIPCFNRYYGEELLSELNCLININKQNTWLHKMLREPRVSCHPLRHILILGFLGENISSLDEKIESGLAYKPFGDGPWICLNKAADHYQKEVINSCTITRDYKTDLPIGTFSCECGFVFSRKGPDQKKEDRLKRGRIKVFGHVWERKLKELLNQSLSLRETAKILGVDPVTIKNKKSSKLSCKESNQQNTLLNKKRKEWIALLKDNKMQTITKIRSLNSGLYTWLYRNDLEWLHDHYPKFNKNITYKKRVDWVTRDKEIAEQVEIIANEIKSDTENLQRVTKNEIGRRIENISLASLYKNANKMPKTQTVISEYVESIEQYQIRRIKRIARSLRESNPFFKEWELIRVAGLKKKFVQKHKSLIEYETNQ
ncbi:TnsD family Tn7-like transposition protein [Gracilibacillus dipsosauri]|uniref:Transposon Tn7 transposition protein TnsD C-terminal domain-containing protein n=1 Tax=Gracilibacillus dipsosauri TaxID=178340 RepID=A0A317L6A9_9BACI|nr:TnsD family Tn7-like transposition protein [Gracilibacillus dipsosauri]PWU70438.1 hypothetical protein DLJ74_00985 [Gracilibacillus dipsosauri]